MSEYEVNKYMEYKNDIHNNKGLTENVTETSIKERNEYMLLIMWLIITIFVFTITILTIISESEINPYLMYLVSVIIMILIFYIIMYIYNIIW